MWLNWSKTGVCDAHRHKFNSFEKTIYARPFQHCNEICFLSYLLSFKEKEFCAISKCIGMPGVGAKKYTHTYHRHIIVWCKRNLFLAHLKWTNKIILSWPKEKKTIKCMLFEDVDDMFICAMAWCWHVVEWSLSLVHGWYR